MANLIWTRNNFSFFIWTRRKINKYINRYWINTTRWICSWKQVYLNYFYFCVHHIIILQCEHSFDRWVSGPAGTSLWDLFRPCLPHKQQNGTPGGVTSDEKLCHAVMLTHIQHACIIGPLKTVEAIFKGPLVYSNCHGGNFIKEHSAPI